MKTTEQVLKETKLTRSMLKHLVDLLILPKPKIRGLGRGKGVVGLFQDDVIDTINQVKNLQEQGFSLREIAQKARDEHAAPRAEVAGELVGQKPNPELVNWAVDRFAELAEKYPGYSYGQITIDEELPNGTVRGRFFLSKKPKNK